MKYMREIYKLLEKAVEEQNEVAIAIGGESFSVKLMKAAHNVGAPQDGEDLKDLATIPSVDVEIYEVNKEQ